MPGFVKTPADEKKWKNAKEIVKKQYGTVKWPIVTHIFKQMKKSSLQKLAINQNQKEKMWELSWKRAIKSLRKPGDKFTKKEFLRYVLPLYLDMEKRKMASIKDIAHNICMEITAEGDKPGPSREKPPKEFWDYMYAEVKKNNPDYDDEMIRKTIGAAWYQKIRPHVKTRINKENK